MWSRDVALSFGRWALPATVSAWFWWAVLPAVAGGAGVAAALAVTILVVWIWRHPVAFRFFWWSAAPPTGQQGEVLREPLTLLCRAGLGPPRVSVRVAFRCRGGMPVPAGPGQVLVPSGLVAAVASRQVSPHEAAAGLCHAAAVARRECVRQDEALRLWCLPWLLVSIPLRALRRLSGRLPGVAAISRVRLLLCGIASVQAWQAGGPAVSVLLVGIGAMSCVQPVLERSAATRVQQVGDRAVADAGLGEAYLQLVAKSGYVVSPNRQALLTVSHGGRALSAAER